MFTNCEHVWSVTRRSIIMHSLHYFYSPLVQNVVEGRGAGVSRGQRGSGAVRRPGLRGCPPPTGRPGPRTRTDLEVGVEEVLRTAQLLEAGHVFGIQGRGLRHPEAVLHPQGEPGLRGASTINIELEALVVKETGRVSLINVIAMFYFYHPRDSRHDRLI